MKDGQNGQTCSLVVIVLHWLVIPTEMRCESQPKANRLI